MRKKSQGQYSHYCWKNEAQKGDIWCANHHHAWGLVQDQKSRNREVRVYQMASKSILVCILLQWWYPGWLVADKQNEGCYCSGKIEVQYSLYHSHQLGCILAYPQRSSQDTR